MAVHLSKTVALVSDVTFCLLDFIGTECLFFIKNTFKFSYVYVRTLDFVVRTQSLGFVTSVTVASMRRQLRWLRM